MQCPSCNNEVLAGEAFCDNCGAALQTTEPLVSTSPINQPEPAIAAPPPGPRVAKLVIDSNGTVLTLTPGKIIVVGREDPIDGIYPDIDLTPHDTDVGVSRRHAELHEQGGQWFLKDLRSTNYTVINRQRAQPDQEVLLQPGDEIRFGRVMTHFQID